MGIARLGARRLVLAALGPAALACVAAVFAMAAGPAQGYDLHDYLFQITEVPATGPSGETVPIPGKIDFPSTMAVDGGHLWASDESSAKRVDEFDDATGAFLGQLPRVAGFEYVTYGLAVGHATGAPVVYAEMRETSGSQNAAVGLFSESGTLEATWTGADTPQANFGFFIAGIAVDNSANLTDWAAGDVYVADRKLIDVFKPETGGKEKYVTQITGTAAGAPFSGIEDVAVSSANGDVFVAQEEENGEGVIDVFAPGPLAGEYEFVRQITGPPPSGAFPGRVSRIAIDSGDGDIYVQLHLPQQAESLVEEFSEAGAFIGQVTAATVPGGKFGEPDGPVSVAVDSESHHVFVGVNRQATDGPKSIMAFGANVVLPDVTTTAVGEVVSTGEGSFDATLNGTVNPDGAGDATCAFVWGATPQLASSAPCAAAVANGEGPQAVHAPIAKLEPDVTYSYRLQASNANGANPGEAWQDVAFTTPGPGMRGSFARDVNAEAATLGATIDPHGVPTSCYFEYVDRAGYDPAAADPYAAGARSPGPVSIGSGEADVNCGSHITGLAATTTYHYRVVVLSELEPGKVETFHGPDRTIATQPPGASLQLPDNRRWELVSPPDKHGAQLAGLRIEALAQASASGNAMTYFALFGATESEPQGADLGGQVLSLRETDGWTSKDIATNNSVPSNAATSRRGWSEYLMFSEDLSTALLEPQLPHTPFSPLEACTASGCVSESFPEATEYTSYIRHDDSCESERGSCFEPLLTGASGYADVPAGTKFGEPTVNDRHEEFLDATPDLKHVLIASRVQLTETPISQREIYEWSADAPAKERVQLVSILPESEGDQPATGYRIKVGSSETEPTAGGWRPISDDGSRVFFTFVSEVGEEALYMRDRRDSGKGETIRLDVPQPGASGNGEAIPEFEAASADGSKVFFRDRQQLTVGASASGYDLYECEIVEEGGKDKCRLSDLTPETEKGESAEVEQFIPGTSEDGSYVYFVANAALAPDATPGGCYSEAKQKAGVTCNLYVHHEGKTKLVATLSYMDANDWGGEDEVFRGSIGALTARVSPNGRYIAFMSDRSLTGYDNADAATGEPDEEVYLYDAVSGKLVCASCNPTGVRPVGVQEVEFTTLREGSHRENLADVAETGRGGEYSSETGIAANLPAGVHIEGANGGLYQSRYLSDSGRLFFNSSDGLVPQDINGQEDVYEYEPPGVGTCTTASSTYSERDGGCIDLISSGTSSKESGFLDASESGGDVFFLTAEKLVPQDYDTALDVYDAHECAASAPCLPPPAAAAPPCESGESCKSAPNPEPATFGAPSSATFAGAGNLAASAPARRSAAPARKQRLERALRACRHRRGARKRHACERQARRRFRPGR